MKLILVLVLLLFAGCEAKDPSTSNQTPPLPVTNESDFLSQLNPQDKLLAVMNQNRLQLVNPHNQTHTDVYQFENNLPNRLTLESFLVSPDGKWVVWHALALGILALNTTSKEVETIYSPTSWFNANPFLIMDETNNVISFIDNEGKTKNSYNLDEGKLASEDIPYPYGTKFVISPDSQKTVYIAGFGQSQVKPSYLLTNSATGEAQNFVSEAELADRGTLVFLSDSQAFVVIEDSNTLVKYPIDNLTQPSLFAQFPDEGRIVDAVGVEDQIFVKLIGGDIVVIDRSDGKILNRIPSEVTAGLNRATIIPWTKNSLLLEEVVTEFEEQFKRLWVSDLRGSKKMLVPEYYRLLQITPQAQPTE